MKPRGLLLIDGNSMGFTAFNAGGKLSAGEIETQGVFGLLRGVRSLMLRNRGYRPIVFWDGRSWRKDAFKEYKGTRDDDPKQAKMREAYKAQRPLMQKALIYCGVSHRTALNMEADDLIGLTVHKMSGRIPMVVVSGDKDLLQLVREGTDWFDMGAGHQRKERRVTIGDFRDQTGFETPAAFVQAKALIGDMGDNLKGVDGIGEKCAALMLSEFNSVPDAIMKIRHGGEAAIPASMSRYRKKLLTFCGNGPGAMTEGVDLWGRNMKLMALTPKMIPAVEGERKIDMPFNAAKFERICEELDFVSILKDFDGWTKPFTEGDFNANAKEAA